MKAAEPRPTEIFKSSRKPDEELFSDTGDLEGDVDWALTKKEFTIDDNALKGAAKESNADSMMEYAKTSFRLDPTETAALQQTLDKAVSDQSWMEKGATMESFFESSLKHLLRLREKKSAVISTQASEQESTDFSSISPDDIDSAFDAIKKS